MPKRHFPRGGSQSRVALKPEVALATVAVFSFCADGKNLNDEEAEAVYALLSGIGLALYEEYSDADLEALFLEVKTMFQEEDPDTVFASAIETLVEDDGLKEAAFIVAVTVVAVDGEVPDTEGEYLEDLRLALQLSSAQAEAIVDELFAEDEEEEAEDEEAEAE